MNQPSQADDMNRSLLGLDGANMMMGGQAQANDMNTSLIDLDGAMVPPSHQEEEMTQNNPLDSSIIDTNQNNFSIIQEPIAEVVDHADTSVIQAEEVVDE